MKKVLVIGDIHGNPIWGSIIQKEDWDEVVFIGDYLDNKFGYSLEDEWSNFLDIIQFKKENPDKVTLLIGNHDYHYIPGINEQYSGYSLATSFKFMQIWKEYKTLFQIATTKGEYLFTHAGVSPQWMNLKFDAGWEESLDDIADKLNELFEYKPRSFKFNGLDMYGDSKESGPLWIRPKSLLRSNKNHPLKRKFTQVVGHTVQESLQHQEKWAGPKFKFIDTLNTSGEYLILKVD